MVMLLSKFLLLSRYYTTILNIEVIQANYIILNISTLFSEIYIVIWLHQSWTLATSDPRSTKACHICGMSIMAMLLSKFLLLSRCYANILNIEVIQANYIILNISTLFSEIYIVIWLHQSWDLATSVRRTTKHGHYCYMPNMARLLS